MKSSTSRRHIIIAALTLLASIGTIVAATVYTYKCPKCGAIQSFDRPSPGIKCARDGWVMTPQ